MNATEANTPISLARIHLILFMSRGMSLQAWDHSGLFEREVALYKALIQKLAGVTLATYGGPEDLSFLDRLGGIDVVCNRWRLPDTLYAWLLPWFLRRCARGKIIVKSNQTSGADLALNVARSLNAPFIARSGYPLRRFTEREYPTGSTQIQAAVELERSTFSSANHIIVTTECMKAQIEDDYGVPVSRVSVVPNYVRTDVFRPNTEIPKVPRRIWFVGRLEPQKNLEALLTAAGEARASLHLVGEGSLRPSLEKKAHAEEIDATFYGNVPHLKLSDMLLTGEAFVLPSLYEGHPKTLLEAMACGLPVISAAVPGIREIIEHGVTGFLCSPDVPSIRDAIQTVLSDKALRDRLGQAAREKVAEDNSLERIAGLEEEILQSLGQTK